MVRAHKIGYLIGIQKLFTELKISIFEDFRPILVRLGRFTFEMGRSGKLWDVAEKLRLYLKL